MCTYELSVPIKATADRWIALGSAPGATVMLGLTAGLSEVERVAMKKRFHEGRERAGAGDEPGGGAGGGPPGGGMGGGPSGGGMGGGPPGGGMSGPGRPGTEMPENPKVWVKLRLAAPAAPTDEE